MSQKFRSIPTLWSQMPITMRRGGARHPLTPTISEKNDASTTRIAGIRVVLASFLAKPSICWSQ